MNPDGALWCISHRSYVAGLVVHDGVVVEAAEALAWTVGSDWQDVKRSLERSGAQVELVPDGGG